LLIGVLFWLSTFALFIWKWRYVANHNVQITIGYLLIVAIFSLLIRSHEYDFIALVGVALTLPWVFFVPSALGIAANPTASLFLCGLINASLFYFGSSWLKKLHPTRAAG
jgi:hypothetical protein